MKTINKGKRKLEIIINKTMLIMMMLAVLFSAQAQVQIKPLPKAGYEKRIWDHVDLMKVVDTHEHLRSFVGLKKVTSLDFMILLFQYNSDELQSAGMPSELYGKLNTMTVMEKWQAIKPYWEASSNTAMNREVLLAADKLFGVKNIDSSTVEVLSEKIRDAYKDPDRWFKYVLEEKCNMDYVIVDLLGWLAKEDHIRGNPTMFKHVKKFDHYIGIRSKDDFNNFTRLKSINSLKDLESALAIEFKNAIDSGYVGVKSALAYGRILKYDNVTKEKAEKVFNKISNASGELSFDEVKPLQDYMMHRVLDLARKYHLPVQIHTGLQAGLGNTLENSKPTHLVNLFQEYPDVKFILFHGSYPYGGELATLAKNFRNVFIDMCWLYIISPSYSERYLNEWLETVPANKIMAFGADHEAVEKVYSHLLMAKQVVSNVLISKVKDGYFSEEEAIKIAQMILHDNAVRILNLK